MVNPLKRVVFNTSSQENTLFCESKIKIVENQLPKTTWTDNE